MSWGGKREGAGRKPLSSEERAARAAQQLSDKASTAQELAIRIIHTCMKTGEEPIALVHDVLAEVRKTMDKLNGKDAEQPAIKVVK